MKAEVVLLGGLIAVVVLIVAIVLFVPVVHHVGDTRWCTGTGTGFSGGKPVVITVTIPCGKYEAGDPDVTR